jgi:hypothetical protein
MRVLLDYFNAKVDKKYIFKHTIGNENLHEISNDNGIRVVTLATSENLMDKSTICPHPSFHKYTWTSSDRKTQNQIDHILIDRRRHSSVLDILPLRAIDCDTDHFLVVAMFRERIAVNKQGSHKFHMERFNLK